MIASMNRLIQWFAIGLAALFLTSCGIPALTARTVDNTLRQVGDVASGNVR